MRHIESQIQQACVKWFRMQFPQIATLCFAVPNGGGRNKLEAAIMKGEGVTAGVADMLLLVPSKQYHGLCIEFKKEKTETSKRTYQSPEQKRWQAAVEAQGYRYAVCRSVSEFVDLVIEYLGN